MRIVVMDGRGGGIGKTLVEKLCAALPNEADIVAAATNATAAAAMRKAGANAAKTGEKAIVQAAACADVIVGTIGILAGGAIQGEWTPRMARAVSESGAVKFLVPLNRCQIIVAGTKDKTLADCVEDVVALVCAYVRKKGHEAGGERV